VNEERARDFVMARLGGARASLTAAMEALDDALTMFINPDDDKKGTKRAEAIDAALEAASCASRGIESAQARLDDIDPKAIEPWEEEDDAPAEKSA